MRLTERHNEYWSRNLNLTLVLTIVWFTVTFVMSFFARELATINFFGWPLSFYLGAQGSLIVYLIIVWVYARKMDQLDHEYGVNERVD